MDDPFQKFMNNMERKTMKLILDELNCPPDIEKFFDCLVKNGCPGLALIHGIVEFAQYLKEKDGQNGVKIEFTPEQFKELLKGTNIKVQEEDGNE